MTADLDRRLAPEGQCERGRPRPGRERRVAQPAARQLLDHRRGERRVAVGRVHRRERVPVDAGRAAGCAGVALGDGAPERRDRSPRPGPAGRAGAGGRSRTSHPAEAIVSSNRSWVASPCASRAAGHRFGSPAARGPRRRSRPGRRGRSTGRREARLAISRAGADPADLGELHGRERAGPELDRAPRVVGAGRRSRRRRSESRSSREQRPSPRGRATAARPARSRVGLHRGQPADGLGRRPDAVGVDADPRIRRPRASRTASTWPHRPATPTLSLKVAKAALGPGGRVRWRRRRARPAGQRRVAASIGSAASRAEQPPEPERPSASPARSMQRHLDRRLGRRRDRPRQRRGAASTRIGRRSARPTRRVAQTFAELSHRSREATVPPRSDSGNGLAEPRDALLRSQPHQHHLAPLEPSAGGDVGLLNGRAYGDRSRRA